MGYRGKNSSRVNSNSRKKKFWSKRTAPDHGEWQRGQTPTDFSEVDQQYGQRPIDQQYGPPQVKTPVFDRGQTIIWQRATWMKFPCDDNRFQLSTALFLNEFPEEKCLQIRKFITDGLYRWMKPHDLSHKNGPYFSTLLCDVCWKENGNFSPEFVTFCCLLREMIEE